MTTGPLHEIMCSGPALYDRMVRKCPALKNLLQNRNSNVIATLEFLVGAGGFEPPKLKAADLQSVPIGHSGTRPYSVFAV